MTRRGRCPQPRIDADGGLQDRDPARYASSRLPGKPLADIGGKADGGAGARAGAGCGCRRSLVATDHEGVAEAVGGAGGSVVLTRADHPSGTDRLAEVVAKLGWDDETLVVNVQGDEPLIDPALVGQGRPGAGGRRRGVDCHREPSDRRSG